MAFAQLEDDRNIGQSAPFGTPGAVTRRFASRRIRALQWLLQRDLYQDFLVVLDIGLMLTAAAAATAIGVHGRSVHIDQIAGIAGVAITSAALYIALSSLFGGYRRHCDMTWSNVALTGGKTFVLMVSFLWVLEHLLFPSMHMISLWQSLGLAGATAVSCAVRLTVAREISSGFTSSAMQPRRIAVVGDPGTAAQFLNRVPIWRWGYEMVGFFADDISKELGKGVDARNILDLVELARNQRLDDILIATSDNDDLRLEATVRQLCILPVRIYATPSLATMSLKGASQRHLGSQPVLEVVRPGIYGRRLIVKRALDLAIASAALPFFLVLFPLIALAIRLESRGPVLFRQPRQGYNDQVFEIFKFRTMKVQETGETVKQATRNDPRVTRVGALLRKTSLDELPQLINVLRGDMSIVGPRPHVAKQNSYYGDFIDRYARRHTVLPGITGWAQISGHRGETSAPEQMADRIKYDLYYIENWSLTLDIYILFRTLFVFLSKNAY